MARGHYAHQIQRIQKHFPVEQVLIMTTEQLTTNSEASLAQIQRFIGLEPDASITLGKRNASDPFVPRDETVQRLRDEFAESNHALAGLLESAVPWI